MAKRHESLDADIVEAPLYRRVVDALREDIVSGRSAVGDRLPTEDALCRRFGVSRHTVREALRAPREEGLVASRQGAGFHGGPARCATALHLFRLQWSRRE